MYIYRRVGSRRLRISTKVLKKIGVFPIIDHYYEPLFNDIHIEENMSVARKLPGIKFNEEKQIDLLNKLNYQAEFSSFIDMNKNIKNDSAFSLPNESFGGGDAEFLFNFVRHIRPKNIIEIGCGNSTKIIQHAVSLNNSSGYRANHICVEPYEQPWLAHFPNIKLLRKKVESLEVTIFNQLEEGDLLFIDSSHIIRPQGDVLSEYLQIIPSLKKGVYIHIHDIFTPHDYLETWIKESVRFWNEQYILEALLTDSVNLEVVASLNLLKHKYFESLSGVCPYLSKDSEPGSFYIQKTL